MQDADEHEHLYTEEVEAGDVREQYSLAAPQPDRESEAYAAYDSEPNSMFDPKSPVYENSMGVPTVYRILEDGALETQVERQYGPQEWERERERERERCNDVYMRDDSIVLPSV